MKKILFCIALAGFAGTAALAQKAKLSPMTRMFLADVKKSGDPYKKIEGHVYKSIGGKLYASALVKVNNNINEADVTATGAITGTKAGNIWTVQIPVEKVNAFTQVAGIDYIQLDEPMAIQMDSARVATHVDSVHAGINLPMPYTGKNVVVGIIDAGFDYSHPTFFDTTGTAFRIKKVWEQKSSGTPPAGFAYGSELADSNAMWAAHTDNVTFSHGSHVAGITAGSGYGSDTTNTRFRGMSYESDLVMVGIMPAPTQWLSTGISDVVDGMNYIYSYANSVSKPCAVNLSWGSTTGPHDGTALFSQACDNMTGPGKIFVCSGGNNGGNRIHLNKTFTNTDTLLNTWVTFDPNLGEKKTWVDIWGDAGMNFCVQLSLFSGASVVASTGYICLDNQLHDLYLIGNGGDTCFVKISTSASEFNGKPRVFFDINSKVSNNVVVSVKSTSGNVHAWEAYVANGHGYYGQFSTFPGLQSSMAGNSNMTISGDLGCTNSAITVAAYATKNIYTGVNGVTTNYTTYAAKGAIAPFSSEGPTVDGRTKPDIAAPGLVLGSAVNSYDSNYIAGGANYNDVVKMYHKPANNRDYSYGMMMGTSMSSPAACGIIALMLEANPQLKPQQVREILYATAIKDSYTGAIPASGNKTWGGGKINAYAAIFDVVHHTTDAQNASSNKDVPCILFPNPNNGSFRLGYYKNDNETLSVEVFDISGKRVLAEQWNVSSGYNTKQFTLSAMGKGIYFTKVSNSEGSTTIKTIIQ